MNIIYLTHQFFPRHIGGVEVYTLGLAKRALEAGHQVTVVTYHETVSVNTADYGFQYTSYDGIPVIEVHYNLSKAPNPTRYEYNNAFTANILRHIVSKSKPDIIHVMHAMKISAAALNVFDKAGIPFIVTLCDFWFICPRHTLLKWNLDLCNGPLHPLYCVRCVQDLHGFVKYPNILKDASELAKRNSFIKRSLLKAKRIIALSNFQKKMYAENGIPAERVEVIQHGLDQLEVQNEARSPIEPYCIGYIGSIVEHKGVHILLEALARIPSAKVQCKIYGYVDNSPYVNRLLKFAEKDSRVQFMGAFEPSNLSNVITSFDVLALPALWYENEPLVVKAALSVGVPVMCTDVGSLADMIVDNKTGWLVPFGDIDAWANMIQKVINQLPEFNMQPVQVKTMNENAKEIFSIYAEVLHD